MSILRAVLARVRALFRRNAICDEIRDEMHFHVDRRTAEYRERGLTEDDAARTARRKFGNVAVMVDRGYDVRGAGMLETVVFEVRHAIRSLWRHRGASAFAVAIMAVTMTAATVTFSVADAVALRPLPYGAPDELVSVTAPSPTAGRFFPASPQDYFAWLEGTRSFEGLAAARFVPPRALTHEGRSVSLVTRAITANLFDVLRVRPAIGRIFGPEHEHPGGPAEVILSHGVWTRYFEASPDVLGRRLDFGAESFVVIGVMPAGVWYPISAGPPTDLYIPYVPTPTERDVNDPRRLGTILVVGRLNSDTTVAEASADANRISSAVVIPLHHQVVGPARVWLRWLLISAAFVVLVACVNVASLLLARTVLRTRELGTREALGASRRRLATGLLIEGLMLSILSTAVAVVASYWAVAGVRAVLPADLARVDDIAVDLRVLAVAALTAIVCGVVFATAPAWQVGRAQLTAALQADSTGVVGGRRRNRALSAFLVADLALVGALLVVTTLVVSTFVRLETMDVGFDRRNIVLLSYARSIADVAERDRAAAATTLRDELMATARAVHGVTHVAFAANGGAPFGGSTRYSLTIPGIGEIRGEEMFETASVSPGYFEAMGIDSVSGRVFQSSDRAGSPAVMVINDMAARRYFPDRDPVGQIVDFRGPTTIVGVVRSVHHYGPEQDLRPAMYVPADQQELVPGGMLGGTLVVRTAHDPHRYSDAIVEAIRPLIVAFAEHPRLSVPAPVMPYFVGDNWRRLTATRRFSAAVMATFGLVAALIAALGVYGTTTFVVAQQTRAIGLRTALGASQARVMRDVLAASLCRVATGTAIGLTVAWMASGLFVSFVFGIEPTAPSVYLGVAAFLAAVALAAAWIPARRAANVDPVVALRAE